MLRALIAAALLATPALAADDPVVLPGVVSTAASEIRLAISPDGRRMLWGAIGRDAVRGQLDIWERHREGDGWSKPAPVPFNTEGEDFDPAFSPDGRQVYFHSERPGGFGGTDIYVVDLDPATGRFGAPRNLGPGVNSKGAEWAPTAMPDGGLLFASDGWGGFGRHDLFVATPAGARPRNLGAAVNGPDEDFDAALSPDGRTLLFSSGLMSDDAAKVSLFVSTRTGEGWSARKPAGVGCADFVNGAGFDPADGTRIFYSAACPGGQGRMDIRETRLPRP
jgi:hypothetical protein